MNSASKNEYQTHSISLYQLLNNSFVFIGFTSFTLALFLPVFFTSAEDIFGYWILATGWMGIIVIQFSWFANPLNLLALLLAKKRPRIALFLSLIALFLATEAFLFREIPTDVNQGKIFINEFGLGFYIWYTAHCSFLLALLCNYFNKKANKN